MRTVLFSQFKALLMIPYVISGCLTPFLNDLYKKSPKKIQVLLESMWEIIPVSHIHCKVIYLIYTPTDYNWNPLKTFIQDIYNNCISASYWFICMSNLIVLS